MKKYYHESVGECVSQVYELDAKSWEEAKREAFDDMEIGDILAECQNNAIVYDGDYASIDPDKCTKYAKLERGTWAEYPSGVEYWEPRAWYFSDEPDTYYNGNFEEFDEWEGFDDKAGGIVTGRKDNDMNAYYGAITTSGEIVVMSISDDEPAVLQGPEIAEYLANIKLWEPLPDDYDDDNVAEWLTEKELAERLFEK
jgi:hypothetical protein